MITTRIEAHFELTDIVDIVRHLRLAEVDAGIVQDIVDHRQQMLAAVTNIAGIFDIHRQAIGAEGIVGDDLREADDRVERRAKLMAHIGEELAFGAVCKFRLFLCFAERCLDTTMIGDIARHQQHHPAGLGWQRHAGEFGEERRSIRSGQRYLRRRRRVTGC